MGLKMNKSDFNTVLATLNKEYRIYAPKILRGKGHFQILIVFAMERFNQLKRLFLMLNQVFHIKK